MLEVALLALPLAGLKRGEVQIVQICPQRPAHFIFLAAYKAIAIATLERNVSTPLSEGEGLPVLRLRMRGCVPDATCLSG